MANDTKAWDLTPKAVGGWTWTGNTPLPTPAPLTYPADARPGDPPGTCSTPHATCKPKTLTVPEHVVQALRSTNEAHEVAAKIEAVLTGTGPEPCSDGDPKTSGPLTRDLHDLNQMLTGLVSRLYAIAGTLGA